MRAAAPAQASATSKIRGSGLAAPTTCESITGTPAKPDAARFSAPWPSEFVTITTASPARWRAAIVSMAPGVGSLQSTYAGPASRRQTLPYRDRFRPPSGHNSKLREERARVV